MKKQLIILSFLPLLLNAQNKPKLVVGIVVDQMRYEMLDRFKNDFGPNGFNKLVNEGLHFDSCYIEYVPTYTGPGHATIFTGSTPAEHGILSNDIYSPSLKETHYCVEDNSVEPIGTSDKKSRVSPRNLKKSGLGDIFKSMSPESKVISIAIKDRGAILSGGKNPDAAYWMDDNGNMVSSTHYMQMLPEWVDAFNKNDLVGDFMVGEWELLKDQATYDESLPDNSPYESTRLGSPPSLPYDLAKLLANENKKAIAYTPFGNTILTEFAIEAIDFENLGQDEETDMLALIYSATDYIGHDFGPRSVEIQDTYLRLDAEIARLIEKLDNEIGRSNYIIFLSSDHGAAETPSDSNFKYVKNADLKKRVNAYTKGIYGVELAEHIGYSQIWLNNNLLKQKNLDKEEIIDEINNYLSYQQEIPLKSTFSNFQIANCTSGDCMLFKNAFDPKLSGDIFYIRPYGHIERSASFGTTHSTSHEYDAHVPLVFFGGNVQAGKISSRIGSHQIIGELQRFFW